MTLRAIKDRAISVGVNWTLIKAAFAAGVLVGFVTMAIAVAGGQAFVALLEAVR